MTFSNPLSEASGDTSDLETVREALQGRREALEALVERHQGWIYNIVRRMTFNPADAEDATQEILIKLITGLATFEGRSSFRTWLYRIVVNHVRNMKRGRSEAHNLTFARYGDSLNHATDADLPDPRDVPADVQLLLEEAKTVCTTGMLLCLDRDQRLVFILGEILGVTSSVGAELLEVSPDNFRQQLFRARRDLYSFLQSQCGLVNTANPCRCAKKTRAFIEAGYVNPSRLLFVSERVTRVREATGAALQGLEALEAQYAAIYREQPFLNPPDFVASLRDAIQKVEVRAVLDDQP